MQVFIGYIVIYNNTAMYRQTSYTYDVIDDFLWPNANDMVFKII